MCFVLFVLFRYKEFVMKIFLCFVFVGDYYFDIVVYQVIFLVIDDVVVVLEQLVKYDWFVILLIVFGEVLVEYDVIWVVFGSLYCYLEGVFIVICYVWENSIFFFGICGGFQYVVIEYVCNVFGWQDVGYVEIDSEGWMVIVFFSCLLVEIFVVVELWVNMLIVCVYGWESIEEGYYCWYGVSSVFVVELEQGDLCVIGWDEEGEICVVELVMYLFFVVILFQYECYVLDGCFVLLVQVFFCVVV